MIKLFVLSALIPLLISQPVVVQDSSDTQTQVQVEPKELDSRAQILSTYLAKHNSPLQYHSQDFIEAADTYELDWKLVPAIAGVESTFGKRIPGGFNGWGWGVYGTRSIYFNSWRDGIFTVSKGLKENYIDDGLTNPYSMNKRYAASPTWGSKVNFFLKDMGEFAKEYKGKSVPLKYQSVDLKTAHSSAKIAYN